MYFSVDFELLKEYNIKMILKISKTLSWSAFAIILLSITLLLLGYDQSNGATQNIVDDSGPVATAGTVITSEYFEETNIVSGTALQAGPVQFVVASN